MGFFNTQISIENYISPSLHGTCTEHVIDLLLYMTLSAYHKAKYPPILSRFEMSSLTPPRGIRCADSWGRCLPTPTLTKSLLNAPALLVKGMGFLYFFCNRFCPRSRCTTRGSILAPNPYPKEAITKVTESAVANDDALLSVHCVLHDIPGRCGGTVLSGLWAPMPQASVAAMAR